MPCNTFGHATILRALILCLWGACDLAKEPHLSRKALIRSVMTELVAWRLYWTCPPRSRAHIRTSCSNSLRIFLSLASVDQQNVLDGSKLRSKAFMIRSNAWRPLTVVAASIVVISKLSTYDQSLHWGALCCNQVSTKMFIASIPTTDMAQPSAQPVVDRKAGPVDPRMTNLRSILHSALDQPLRILLGTPKCAQISMIGILGKWLKHLITSTIQPLALLPSAWAVSIRDWICSQTCIAALWGKLPKHLAGASFARCWRHDRARIDDQTRYIRLNIVIGLYCPTLLALETFSRLKTSPVITDFGQSAPRSMQSSMCSIPFVKSSERFRRSRRDHPSGPTAACFFFFLSACFHCEIEMGSHGNSFTGATTVLKKEVMGSQKSSGTSECLSHLACHSLANLSNNSWSSAANSDCLMIRPGCISSGFSITNWLSWSPIRITLSTPVSWYNGFCKSIFWCESTVISPVSRSTSRICIVLVSANIVIGDTGALRTSAKILFGSCIRFSLALQIRSWRSTFCISVTCLSMFILIKIRSASDGTVKGKVLGAKSSFSPSFSHQSRKPPWKPAALRIDLHSRFACTSWAILCGSGWFLRRISDCNLLHWVNHCLYLKDEHKASGSISPCLLGLIGAVVCWIFLLSKVCDLPFWHFSNFGLFCFRHCSSTLCYDLSLWSNTWKWSNTLASNHVLLAWLQGAKVAPTPQSDLSALHQMACSWLMMNSLFNWASLTSVWFVFSATGAPCWLCHAAGAKICCPWPCLWPSLDFEFVVQLLFSSRDILSISDVCQLYCSFLTKILNIFTLYLWWGQVL